MEPRVLITCPPMLGEPGQIRELAAIHAMDVTCPEVIQTLSDSQLIDQLPHFDGWIAGDDPGTETVLKAGRKGNLRALLKWGVGVDNIDRNACNDLGIAFDHTPGMFSHEVADLALAYTIMLARDLLRIDRGVRSGGWPKPQGISLRGKTVGLVGYGNIGREIAKRLEVCGVNLVIYDPFIDVATEPRIRAWPDKLDKCDFLILASALTNANFHLVDAVALERCKPGVRIVNVSRGPLIDESALEQALTEEKVSFAALDVFEIEPLPATSRLRQFECCVFGSHNASNTKDAVMRTNAEAFVKLSAMLQGA